MSPAVRVSALPAFLAVLAAAEMTVVIAPHRLGALCLLVTACAALLLRFRRPMASAISSGLLVLAVPWVGPQLNQVSTIALVGIVACFTAGRWVANLRGLAAVAVLLAADVVTYVVVDERDHGVSDAIVVLTLSLSPYVFGRIARRLADDGEVLRREQELLRRTAVRDERDRIAVVTHDVVAHSISAMVVQASAAADLVDRDPDRAAALLDGATSAGRNAIDETGRLLRLLRDTDDELGVRRGPLTARR